jgi:hypothetical protein
MEAVTQVSVVIPNVPSSLAMVGLRAADVNISAITCTEGHPHTTVHLIVSDPETAKLVLSELGHVHLRPVIAVMMKNKPGAIAGIGRSCAAAHMNIRNIYSTTCGKEAMVYIDTDDVPTAMQQLKQNKMPGMS